MCCSVTAPVCNSTTSLPVLITPEWKPLPEQIQDECSTTSTVSSNDVLRQRLYQHLSMGYQLPTVWYHAVMKKSIIDPLSNFQEYDLPTVTGHAERKDVPEVSTHVTPIKDPNQSEVSEKMVLPLLVTIRRKKMKKHRRKKWKKKMRFVLRRKRQLKANRKEREIQKYEREQVKMGERYSAEQYVDEQLALARKSGWHIDIIAEFNRAREKEKAAASSSDSSSKQ